MSRAGTHEDAVLAARAGRYTEYAPAPALGAHFGCLWSHDIHEGADQRIAIVPDGYCDIVWVGGRLVVAGPDRSSAFPTLAGGERIVGARFAPGAAAEWLKVQLCDIVGQSIPLEDFWGAAALRLNELLCACANSDERLLQLRSSLEQEAAKHATSARDMASVFARASDISQSRDVVDAMLDDLSIGARQLRRRCHAHFGYGPKTLARIRRFQGMLGLCRSKSLPLAELAVAAGYADQAHMTRDVREISTLTPMQLQQQIAG
ncbi:AraC family transcriptional regulator [Rhizobium sp. R72]|uniref:helix-turn-helix domain-containing protein n=1 Tax=unclassified Rhizobium TaxID=2613769 RepID=UPI000B53319C|nr:MULTISPECIES: helix-turn-helix domain-containing protein [unclassified Rhizobium]OWV86785.1 AraC family transcriptional regulator [Rhizobium sp. R693]OWV95560.1 AraC family transcriptional regulator [Rhizobium sp. R72]OWV95860.1 AraC family transcriptional regulator [Rhizobium sp. R711]